MSKYSLFSRPGKEKVEEALATLIQEFTAEYEALKEDYPHSGLGDTATDERVVSRLYGVMHFGDWGWPEKEERNGGPGKAV